MSSDQVCVQKKKSRYLREMLSHDLMDLRPVLTLNLKLTYGCVISSLSDQYKHNKRLMHNKHGKKRFKSGKTFSRQRRCVGDLKNVKDVVCRVSLLLDQYLKMVIGKRVELSLVCCVVFFCIFFIVNLSHD